jgi:hypothetical protein
MQFGTPKGSFRKKRQMQGARLSSNEAHLGTSKQRDNRSNAVVGEFFATPSKKGKQCSTRETNHPATTPIGFCRTMFILPAGRIPNLPTVITWW